MSIPALIALLENAREPLWALDHEMARHFGDADYGFTPRYTSSLDATMLLADSLFPESRWSITRTSHGFRCELLDHVELISVEARHEVATIALCLAVLKAKEGEK